LGKEKRDGGKRNVFVGMLARLWKRIRAQGRKVRVGGRLAKGRVGGGGIGKKKKSVRRRGILGHAGKILECTTENQGGNWLVPGSGKGTKQVGGGVGSEGGGRKKRVRERPVGCVKGDLITREKTGHIMEELQGSRAMEDIKKIRQKSEDGSKISCHLQDSLFRGNGGMGGGKQKMGRTDNSRRRFLAKGEKGAEKKKRLEKSNGNIHVLCEFRGRLLGRKERGEDIGAPKKKGIEGTFDVQRGAEYYSSYSTLRQETR